MITQIATKPENQKTIALTSILNLFYKDRNSQERWCPKSNKYGVHLIAFQKQILCNNNN